MTIRCLHHLLLLTTDLSRSVAFYERLGMEPIPSLSPRIRWMRMGPSELHLMHSDEPWQNFRDEPSPHFAIESDDIALAQQLIPTIGGEILQEIKTRPHDSSLYLFATDPDGNRFEITQHTEDWHLRFGLIDELRRRSALTGPRVEGAMRSVPRHLFLPKHSLAEAYADQPIQTKSDGEARSSCSQPSIVAIMLEMLGLASGAQVLEVGAGTGWNAALMSVLAGPQGRVTSLDIDADTVESARQNLERAGIQNVQAVQADGGFGWPENAPYDAIIASCGVSDISPLWAEQLREGGVLVAPMWLNTAQFCCAWRKVGGVLRSQGGVWAGFMPLRGHFATDRGTEFEIGSGKAKLLFDEMHGFDIKSLAELLQSEPRAVDLPEEATRDAAFLEYVALRGEPLLTVTLPDAAPLLALSCAPGSLLVLSAGAPSTRLYGSDLSLSRLRDCERDWKRDGKPGVAQARIEAAPRGALGPEPGAFLARKKWMDYRTRFKPRHDAATDAD